MSGIICPHCGQVHREGAKFCVTTGKLIPAVSSPPAASPPPDAGVSTSGVQPAGGASPAASGPAQPRVFSPQRFPAASSPPAVSPPPSPPLQAGLTGRLPPNSFLRSRYLILRKVGHGGMAAVYQAADTSQPGTQWAIKEMSDAGVGASDRDFAVQSFMQEGNLLRALNHPNLPRVTDVFTEAGKHYLVMEFVAGQTLQSM